MFDRFIGGIKGIFVTKHQFLQAASQDNISIVNNYLLANKHNSNLINTATLLEDCNPPSLCMYRNPYKFPYNQTALILAAYHGNSEIVSKLLESRCIDVNAKDSCKNSALSYAIKNGYPDIVEALINHPKMDFKKISQLPYLRLIEQAYHNQKDQFVFMAAKTLAKKLISTKRERDHDFKYDLNHKQIRSCIKNDKQLSIEMIGWLIENNQRNQPYINNFINDNKETALMLAAKYGKFDIVEMMLFSPDINVSICNDEGKNAEQIAIENGYNDIARVIAAAREKKPNSDLNTPHLKYKNPILSNELAASMNADVIDWKKIKYWDASLTMNADPATVNNTNQTFIHLVIMHLLHIFKLSESEKESICKSHHLDENKEKLKNLEDEKDRRDKDLDECNEWNRSYLPSIGEKPREWDESRYDVPHDYESIISDLTNEITNTELECDSDKAMDEALSMINQARQLGVNINAKDNAGFSALDYVIQDTIKAEHSNVYFDLIAKIISYGANNNTSYAVKNTERLKKKLNELHIDEEVEFDSIKKTEKNVSSFWPTLFSTEKNNNHSISNNNNDKLKYKFSSWCI